MPAARRRAPDFGRHDKTILVLQGGGALGAYQAGVYEGLHEAGLAPDWVAGVSIGAINAALIAGNAPDERVARLREFWDRVSSGLAITLPASLDALRLTFNRLSAMATVTFGAPGFFEPRLPPPWFAPDGTPEALSVYDTSPLGATLGELVDFRRVNAREVRLSMGAVNVRTGNSEYFDNFCDDPRIEMRPAHVMASGALPPGFPPVRIAGETYWDGGIVSNTPLWYVLDASPRLNALVFQVDLFSARGPLPRNLEQVLERQKDIQYSSKTRFNTSQMAEMETIRDLLERLLQKAPAALRRDPDYLALTELCRPANMTLVHLINRRNSGSLASKDYEFSRETIRELWHAGLTDMRRSCAHPAFETAIKPKRGVRVYDLTR